MLQAAPSFHMTNLSCFLILGSFDNRLDCLRRTFRQTSRIITFLTDFRIDNREEFIDLDSTLMGAVLHAKTAANAGIRAGLLGNRTFIVRTALYTNRCRERSQLQYALRAGLYALAAACAFIKVYCHSPSSFHFTFFFYNVCFHYNLPLYLS